MFEMTGGIWTIGPVEDEPDVRLEDWSVFEVFLPGIGVRTRHFVGTSIRDREGRTSSPIESFDAATQQGITSSGRVYQLVGHRTGSSLDATYVWNRWKHLNQAEDIVDVTVEIKTMMESGIDGST